jgi:rhamnose utilization protein RhaD (predicted bifunctional aldolase and dehydrogenase)
MKSTSIRQDLRPLLELAARVGRDPMLTQASTGNISLKLEDVLWVKASGKWLADATSEDILIPLDLEDLRASLWENRDPAEKHSNASIETAMHVALPHPVVLHVHSLNAIAWAVRYDAAVQLETRLNGLRWQWIPYVPSGLPLAREIEKGLSVRPNIDVLVLGNHGLVLGAQDSQAAEDLLAEVERRLAIPARQAHPADYARLADLAADSPWALPDDDTIHALATDPVTRRVLEGGYLYPCQAIFSDAALPELFRADPVPEMESRPQENPGRPFLIVKGCGVVVSRTMAAAEAAMLSGLAQVVQRVDPSAPIRYLTQDEVAAISSTAAYRYRDLANASH